MSGGKILEQIKIQLRSIDDDLFEIYLDIYDNSLSKKWLRALNELLDNNYHLEKNYCFLGFVDSPRNGQVILDQVNKSIAAINSANLGYHIDDYFSLENTLESGEVGPMGTGLTGRRLIHDKLNHLHRYFEELQGVSGRMSPFFSQADPTTRWHIRQLNLLCHEYESWALSYRKQIQAPDWQRPSQLMCWLNAPRFSLDDDDYELFGIETINRPLGGIFVGVNKAVGKHHWEVFNDEGRDSRIGELVTLTMRGQTEAAGDFDIEWGRDPKEFEWQQKKLAEFRGWLQDNGFDPNDKLLTIGHPQIGQVNLERSFGMNDHLIIWRKLSRYLDVYSICTGQSQATYDYRWDDEDFISRQIQIIEKGHQ